MDLLDEVEFLWDDAESEPAALRSNSDSEALPDGRTQYRVTQRGATCPGNVVITFLADGSQAEVHPSQVTKTVRILDPFVLRKVMCAKNCRCSRKCFDSSNEHTATEYLAE